MLPLPFNYKETGKLKLNCLKHHFKIQNNVSTIHHQKKKNSLKLKNYAAKSISKSIFKRIKGNSPFLKDQHRNDNHNQNKKSSYHDGQTDHQKRRWLSSTSSNISSNTSSCFDVAFIVAPNNRSNDYQHNKRNCLHMQHSSLLATVFFYEQITKSLLYIYCFNDFKTLL